MDKTYSHFLEEKYESLVKIVEKLKHKFAYVSLLASDCEGKKIQVSDSEIKISDSFWQERGFVVRVFNGTLFSEYSFDDFDNPTSITKKILEAVDVSDQLYKAIYAKSYKNVLYEEEQLEKAFNKMHLFHDVSIEEIIKSCKKIIDDSMEDNEYIISAKCNVEYVKISKLFISNNKNLKQVYAWANAKYECLVNKNEVTKFNFGGESSLSLKEALNKLKEQVSNINNDATQLLDAKDVIPGEYECITTPEITGLIAHEAFGHGVEMDMFVKNRALGQKYLNKKVGSSLLTMHEGALPFNDVGSYFFDDEGFLAKDTLVIENGKLLTGICDAIAASKLKITPTGNGRRQSFKNKVYTRMTNTYFDKGERRLEEMISSIKYGFLIDREISGMEDPKNFGIQCIALIGKEIENGRLTGKVVSPLILTGNVLDLLKSISMVSQDFKLYGTGTCGKGYKEFVKTSVGGPYLKVRVKLG